jgi:hypothetical protein
MASDYPFGIFKLSLFFFISGGKILKYFTFYVKMFVVDPTNITKTVLREEFEDTKGVFRIRLSKKNRQHNCQQKKYKRTNNHLQNTTKKAKDPVTRTPLKTEDEILV